MPDGTHGGANKYNGAVAFGNYNSKDGVCGGLFGWILWKRLDSKIYVTAPLFRTSKLTL